MSNSFPTTNFAEFVIAIVAIALIWGSITIGAYLLAQIISFLGVIL